MGYREKKKIGLVVGARKKEKNKGRVPPLSLSAPDRARLADFSLPRMPHFERLFTGYNSSKMKCDRSGAK